MMYTAYIDIFRRKKDEKRYFLKSLYHSFRIEFSKFKKFEFCLSCVVQFFSIGGDLIYVAHL